MLRRLFTLVSAMSLMLCVATCILWARSYRHTDHLVIGDHNAPLPGSGRRGEAGTIFYSRDGFLYVQRNVLIEPQTLTYYATEISPGISFPHFFVVLALIVLPISWWSRRTRRGISVKFCVKCGYALRATSDRCPECGTKNPVV